MTSNPTNLFGGTVVPFPPLVVFHFLTDKDGTVKFVVPGGGGPTSLFAQYLIFDPNATFGIGLSNAIRIDFQR